MLSGRTFTQENFAHVLVASSVHNAIIYLALRIVPSSVQLQVHLFVSQDLKLQLLVPGKRDFKTISHLLE